MENILSSCRILCLVLQTPCITCSPPPPSRLRLGGTYEYGVASEKTLQLQGDDASVLDIYSTIIIASASFFSFFIGYLLYLGGVLPCFDSCCSRSSIFFIFFAGDRQEGIDSCHRKANVHEGLAQEDFRRAGCPHHRAGGSHGITVYTVRLCRALLYCAVLYTILLQ